MKILVCERALCVMRTAFLCGIMSSGYAGERVVLIENSVPKISIVLPEKPSEAEKAAANELSEYFSKISGAAISGCTMSASGLIPVYLGEAAAPEFKKLAEVPDSFCLSIKPDRIDLTGKGDGTLFAAYELLEQSGVRWFMPGELGTVVPNMKTVSLSVQTTVQSPSFAGRYFQMGDVEWQKRMRCGGPNFPSAHGFPGITPKLFSFHPEYFSLVKGRRTRQQVCLSNPEVLAIVIAKTKEYFRKYPERTTIGIGPNDGVGFCECEKCRALDTGDYDPFSGENSVTDRYIWFFNRVLDGIKDEFPDKKIGFYIYHSYMRPPVREKPNPKITGALAPISLCRLHGPDNPVCPESSYYGWLAGEWGKLIPELWDRGYWSNLADPGFPFIIIQRLRDQIPLGKKAGIYGWRVETFPHWGTQLPDMYIAGKLMWNSSVDVDGLMKDFSEKFFGPASKPMGGYIALMNMTLNNADFHAGSAWSLPNIYPAAMREKAKKLLDEGAGLAPKGIYAERVAMVRGTFELLEAFISMQEARNKVDFQCAKMNLDRLNAIASKLANYKPSMIAPKIFDSYMKRFFQPCIEQGFARVTGGNRLVAPCGDEWEFLSDPAMAGIDLSWFSPSLKGGNWQKLKAYSLTWSDQGLRYYHGMAWYRQTVNIPPCFAGKRLFLWCGGVDELAKVWVNGKEVGISHGAAFYPFELDVTSAAKAGENTIVLAVNNKIVDELGTGGIMAPVILYAPKEGINAKPDNVRKLKPTFP